MRRTLLLAASVLGGISVFWGIYFALQQNWLICGLNLFSILIACTTTWLTLRGRIKTAAALLFFAVYAILCLFCLFLDVPSAGAPRSNHHYFLIIALFASLIFKDANPWLRHGLMVASLAAFVFFASTYWGVTTPYTLADDIRIPGTWLHNVIVIAVLYAMVWVMQANLSERNALESDLRKALLANQLRLYYQPQAGDDGRIVGAEALLRWQHPVKGMISPADFIPLAEATGLILPIGHWVLGMACAQLMTWSKTPATAHLSIAVNVSALQFKQADYVSQVISVIERSGISPALLKLELTESMLVNDVNDIISKMHALKAKGVGLSLDDFGTGYSSLSYLKKLPLDQLKIDQSFVRDLLTDPSDAAIVRTLIALGTAMQLHVIAEGVESEAHRQFLAEMGCHSYQGYLLSKPLPIGEFDALLSAHKTSLPS
jgi:diguanylate cyclase